MQRIIEIEDLNNVDLTGLKQHGFKRKRSTSTAGLDIQSEIARALDSNMFTVMASLDLSSAFDIVNIDLLKIEYAWFNVSFNAFKLKCKTLFLQ